MMTLQEFYKELEKHDWYYYFSDDMGVDRRGAANLKRLESIALEGGQTYQDLMKAYGDHMFSGQPWNTPRAPKPKEPLDPLVEKVAQFLLEHGLEPTSGLYEAGSKYVAEEVIKIVREHKGE